MFSLYRNDALLRLYARRRRWPLRCRYRLPIPAALTLWHRYSHLAAAAFLAIACRCSLDSFLERAVPPACPLRDRPDFGCTFSLISPVARRATIADMPITSAGRFCPFRPVGIPLLACVAASAPFGAALHGKQMVAPTQRLARRIGSLVSLVPDQLIIWVLAHSLTTVANFDGQRMGHGRQTETVPTG
jgi:hypothetical protein